MQWMSAQGGRAVKWLDPTRHPTIPQKMATPPVIILMTRNPREQAKSRIKLVSLSMNGVGRREQKAMERSIRRDVPPMLAKLRSSAIVHELSFEDVLENPMWAARKLGRLVRFHFGLDFDEDAAAGVVFQRPPTCMDHFHVETTLAPLLAEMLTARDSAGGEGGA